METTLSQSPQAFLSDEKNFLYGLDFQKGDYIFLSLTREEISSLAFLDNRMLGDRADQVNMNAGQVLPVLQQQMSAAPANTCHFIFHTAFCCSTMIARCLDLPGTNLSLKEPLAFLGLSGFKRNAPGFDPASPGWQVLRDSTLYFLTRPLQGQETALIKPSNGANNLLPEMLSYPFTGKVLLLYGGLKDFLVSILRGHANRAQYIDEMAQVVFSDFPGHVSIPEADVAALPPLHKAAFFWGVQMKVFEDHAKAGGDRVKSLNAKTFLADPEATLTRLSDFYGFGFSQVTIRQILDSPAFKGHAKEPVRPFSSERRAREGEDILGKHREGIEKAIAWAEANGFLQIEKLSNLL